MDNDLKKETEMSALPKITWDQQREQKRVELLQEFSSFPVRARDQLVEAALRAWETGTIRPERLSTVSFGPNSSSINYKQKIRQGEKI